MAAKAPVVETAKKRLQAILQTGPGVTREFAIGQRACSDTRTPVSIRRAVSALAPLRSCIGNNVNRMMQSSRAGVHASGTFQPACRNLTSASSNLAARIRVRAGVPHAQPYFRFCQGTARPVFASELTARVKLLITSETCGGPQLSAPGHSAHPPSRSHRCRGRRHLHLSRRRGSRPCSAPRGCQFGPGNMINRPPRRNPHQRHLEEDEGGACHDVERIQRLQVRHVWHALVRTQHSQCNALRTCDKVHHAANLGLRHAELSASLPATSHASHLVEPLQLDHPQQLGSRHFHVVRDGFLPGASLCSVQSGRALADLSRLKTMLSRSKPSRPSRLAN